jgi:cytochrome P450
MLQIDYLISQLATYKDVPVNMHYAFRSATLDIIMEYLFANTLDALDAHHFRHPVLCGLQEGLPAFWLMRHFQWVFPVMMTIPPEVVMYLNPPARGVLTVIKTCEKQINGLLANPESLEHADHEIVYHHLMNPDPEKRGHEEASKNRLLDEAHTLLNAGSDTVGGTCTHGVFRVLNDPAILERLRIELDETRAKADLEEDASMNLEMLEKLPYLVSSRRLF